jgi:hypothetical protein
MLMIKSIANKFRLNYLIELITVLTQNKSYKTNFAEFNQILILVIFGIVLQLITL